MRTSILIRAKSPIFFSQMSLIINFNEYFKISVGPAKSVFTVKTDFLLCTQLHWIWFNPMSTSVLYQWKKARVGGMMSNHNSWIWRSSTRIAFGQSNPDSKSNLGRTALDENPVVDGWFNKKRFIKTSRNISHKTQWNVQSFCFCYILRSGQNKLGH